MTNILEKNFELSPQQWEFFTSSAKFPAYGGGWGNGKCQKFDGLIQMADGAQKQIQNVQAGDIILSVKPSGEIVSSKVLAQVDAGIKREIIYTVEGGRRVSVSAEHPFLKLTGLKRVPCPATGKTKLNGKDVRIKLPMYEWTNNVRVGDFVAVPAKLPCMGGIDYNEHMAAAIGYLLGDGSIKSGVGITIDPSNSEQLDFLRSLQIPGVEFRDLAMDLSYSFAGTKHGYNPLLDELRRLGLAGTTSHSKFIPGECFSWDSKSKRALLSGLLVTDGWVDKQCVGFCSVSEALVKGVQDMMLHFGVVGNIYEKFIRYKDSKVQVWTWQTTRAEFIKPLLEFNLLHKQAKLVDLYQAKLAKTNRTGCNARHRVGDILFLKVTGREEGEDVQMYDLTVEGTHNFIGDGICLHNTLAGCLKAYTICQKYPKTRFLIGRKNYTDLRDSTINDFLELYGTNSAFGKFKGGEEKKYILKNGSEILFKHLDNLQSLTNLNLSGAWIDQAEEVAEDSFLFVRGRLRRKGVPIRQLFITFNMEGHNWIYNYWKSKDPKCVGKDPQDYHLIEASTLANKAHLPEDYVRNLENLPPDLYRRYVEGSWEVFEGQIFPEFNTDVHVIDPIQIQDHWLMFEGIDVGVRHPTGYLQAFEDHDNNLYFAKEFRESNLNMGQVAGKIMHLRDGREPTLTVIDPSANKKEQTSGENLCAQLTEEGIYTQNANNSVLASIQRIKKDLTEKRIYVFSTCRLLIEELQQYQWEKPRTYKGQTFHSERPVKVNDDLVDPFRYIVMSRPDRHEVTVPQAKKLTRTYSDLEAELDARQEEQELKYFV